MIRADYYENLKKIVLNLTEKRHIINYHHLIHIKKLRRFFILCLMQAICNTELTLPMHNILADILQVCRWWVKDLIKDLKPIWLCIIT